MNRRRGVLAPFLAAATLIAVTLAVVGADRRFTVRDRLGLANLDFSEGALHWSGRGPGIYLRSRRDARELMIRAAARSPPPHVARPIPDPQRFRYLRISAEVSLRGFGSPAEARSGGYLQLLTFDAGNRRLRHWPADIAALREDTSWRRAIRIVPVHPRAGTVLLAAYAAGAGGTFSLRGISVDAMEERREFRYARIALIGGWAALWGWICLVLARGAIGAPLRGLVLVAANVVLVAGIAPQPGMEDLLRGLLLRAQDAYFSGLELLASEPATMRTAAEDGGPAAEGREPALAAAASGNGVRAATAPAEASSARPAVTENRASATDEGGPAPAGSAHSPPADPRAYWTPGWPDLDKAGHLGSFALLSLLALVAYRRIPLALIVVALGAFAASIQTVQSFSVTREADLPDLWADLLGIALALGAFAGIRAAARPRGPSPNAAER